MGVVAVGVAVGAVVGGAAAAIQTGGDFDAIWKGALVGAVAGGVGGWAAPALAPTLGITSAAGIGALGGGIAGVLGGVGNVALSGGSGEDYLKAGLFGGIGGAATGGALGALGGEAGAVATTPEGAPVATAGGAAPAPISGESGLASNTLETGGFMGSESPATGLSSDVAGGGTQAVQSTVTGAPAPQPQTAPVLSDMYAANNTGTMTDIGGSSPVPQQLSGGYVQPEIGQSSALLDSLGAQGQSSSANSLSALGLNSSIPAEGSSSPFVPNQSNASQYSLGGGDYGVTTSTGDVLNSAGEKLGKAPGWEMPGQATVRGTAELPTSNGFNFGDFLSQTGKGLAGKMLTAGNLLKGVGSVAGYGEAKQNKQQLMDLYNQQNAYNQQLQGMNAQAFNQNLAANTANQQAFRDQLAAAQGYNTQLQNTYTNPNEYLNSPEAQASRSLAMQKLLAQQSAAGRRTSGLAAQNQLMANQLNNLQAYRQGLRQAIQYPNQAPSMGYQATTNPALTLSAAQSQSPMGNALAGLGSIFAPQPNYIVLG